MSAFRNESAELSRRTVLRMMGVGAAAVAGGFSVSACGRDENSGGSGKSGMVSVFTPLVAPEDEKFYNEWFGRFTDETGISVDARFQPNTQYGEALQLSFQSGEEADVFRMAGQQGKLRTVYNKDWIRPLDEFSVVTDTLKEHYPESARDPLISGLHIDGDLYAMPSLLHKGEASVRPMMVNSGLLEQYGITSMPKTHSETAEAAAKITKDSGGDVFGFTLVGGSPYGVKYQPFQNTCGVPTVGTPLNYQNGRSMAADSSFVDSIGFLRGLISDGSMAPGWQTMQPEAFMQSFAQERIAMVVIPAWWANEIQKANSDIQLEFGTQPVPDSGREGYTISISDPGIWASQFGMTRSAKNPENAAELIAFMARPEVQKAYYETTGLVPALADQFGDDLKEVHQKILPLAEELRREAPNPAIRNNAAADVLNTILQNAPDTLEEIIFSAVDAGEDYGGPAASYDQEFNAVIDEAIAGAPDGSGVTHDTFAFPDWNPLQDYVTKPA